MEWFPKFSNLRNFVYVMQGPINTYVQNTLFFMITPFARRNELSKNLNFISYKIWFVQKLHALTYNGTTETNMHFSKMQLFLSNATQETDKNLALNVNLKFPATPWQCQGPKFLHYMEVVDKGARYQGEIRCLHWPKQTESFWPGYHNGLKC